MWERAHLKKETRCQTPPVVPVTVLRLLLLRVLLLRGLLLVVVSLGRRLPLLLLLLHRPEPVSSRSPRQVRPLSQRNEGLNCGGGRAMSARQYLRWPLLLLLLRRRWPRRGLRRLPLVRVIHLLRAGTLGHQSSTELVNRRHTNGESS